MCPVDGLLLGGGIPPGIHDVDVVRFRQRQARPSRLQRDQEHLRLARPELLDNAIAVAGRTIQLHHRDPATLQGATNARQE